MSINELSGIWRWLIQATIRGSGLTGWVKEFTGHFARDGFFALALDLFGGRTAKDDAARADLRNEAEQHRWLQRFALQPVGK